MQRGRRSSCRSAESCISSAVDSRSQARPIELSSMCRGTNLDSGPDHLTPDQCKITTYHPGLERWRNYDFSSSLQGYNEQHNHASAPYNTEDQEDIDILVNLAIAENDDEETSTARTFDYDDESCYEISSAGASECRAGKSLADGCDISRRRKKQEKYKKLMRSLRATIPGSGRMDAATVLDDAVRHLKELRTGLKDFRF